MSGFVNMKRSGEQGEVRPHKGLGCVNGLLEKGVTNVLIEIKRSTIENNTLTEVFTKAMHY